MNESLENLLQKADELLSCYVNCNEKTRKIADIQEAQNIYQKIVNEQPDDYRAWKGLMLITPYLEENVEFAGTTLKVYKDLALIRVSEPEIKKDIESSYQDIRQNIYGYTPAIKDRINTAINNFEEQIKNKVGLEKASVELYLKYFKLLAEFRFPLSDEDKKIIFNIAYDYSHVDLIEKRMSALNFNEAKEAMRLYKFAVEKYNEQRKKLNDRKLLFDEFKWNTAEKIETFWNVSKYLLMYVGGYCAIYGVLRVTSSIVVSLLNSGGILSTIIGILLAIFVFPTTFVFSLPFVTIYYIITETFIPPIPIR